MALSRKFWIFWESAVEVYRFFASQFHIDVCSLDVTVLFRTGDLGSGIKMEHQKVTKT